MRPGRALLALAGLGVLGLGLTAKASSPVPRPLGLRAQLGAALVDVVLEEVGTAEEGHNDGARIREYDAVVGIEPPANWCAAFTTWAVYGAIQRLGLEAVLTPPFRGSGAAKGLRDELAGRLAWVPVGQLLEAPRRLRAGDLLVWDRSQPGKPETAGFGHVGIVVGVGRIELGEVDTVEGNSGPTGETVAAMVRRLDDPRLLGAGWIA